MTRPVPVSITIAFVRHVVGAPSHPAAPRRIGTLGWSRIDGSSSDDLREESTMHFGGRAIRCLSIIGMVLLNVTIGATGRHVVAAAPSINETVLLRTDLAGIDAY